MVRAAPERVQQQEVEAPPVDPPAPQRQFIRADSLTTMQEEQENELKALMTDIPRLEQRFEWLAFWVGAAVAFGAGIW